MFALLAFSQLRSPGWWFQDSEAYWQAAVRLRVNAPLYPALATQDASAVFRYAPWFAAAWVPLTFLPKAVVMVGWTAAMTAAAGYCAAMPLQQRSAAAVCVALVALALLVPAAATGNVQPLIVAGLLWGIERRSGPVLIAAAASLKAAPILLIGVYLGRRQWLRAGMALVITGTLVGPMLLFDLSHYPIDTGAAAGPLASGLAVAVGLTFAVAAIPLAKSRYGWLAAAAGVVFMIPRWSYYQPSFLLIGLARRRKDKT